MLRSLCRTLLLAAILAGVMFDPRQASIAGQSPTTPATTPAPTGVVIGRVVEGTSNTPVPDASVSLTGGTTVRVEINALSGPDGVFVLFNVPAGSFNLTASKPGFWFGTFGQRRQLGYPRRFVVIDGQRMANVTLPVWKTSTISGTVVDEVGEPMVGLSVRCMMGEARGGRLIWFPSAQTARTDDRGAYRLSAFPGDILVLVPTSGNDVQPGDRALVYPQTIYPAATVPNRATVVTLEAGEERTGVNFQLQPAATRTVSGRVVGPDGSPPSGTEVRLFAGDDDTGTDLEIAQTFSGGDGTFALPAIPVGTYLLRAAARAGESGVGGSTATRRLGEPETTMAVTVGDTDVIDLAVALSRGSYVDGVVVFDSTKPKPSRPRAGIVTLELSPDHGRIGALLRTDADGRFRTQGLAPGRYFVRPAQSQLPTGWTLSRITLAGRDVTDDAMVLGNEDVHGLVITLTDQVASVRGTVRNGASNGDDRATLRMFPVDPAQWIDFGLSPPRMRSVRAGSDGQYLVNNVLPGEYFVVAIDDERAQNWDLQTRLEILSRRATRVNVSPGAQLSLNVQLSQGRQVP